MKVFFAVDTIMNAGTERSMLDLAPQFSRNIEFKLVYFYSGHDLKSEYEGAGIPLIFIELKGKFTILKGVMRLMKIIRKEKPDIIVSSLLRANIISRIACKMTGTKLIGTFVSDSYSRRRSDSFSFKRKLGAAYYFWLDRLTSGIPIAWISNSESIKKSNCAALKIREDKVRVIYRGRRTDQFRERGTPDFGGVFRFAIVARLFETKGFVELVDAFSGVAKIHPNIQLDIYGEGPFRNRLKALIETNGFQNKIILHGNVKNAWLKLYEANCFVFPSWYEGFSGALVEAMMTGIPIIASDIPMNLEAVTDKRTALVHSVKDTGDLQDKMLQMVESYPTMLVLGENARKESFERFDMKNIARQYEQTLVSFA